MATPSLTQRDTIEETIVIRCPKSRVWEVLTSDAFTPRWYSEFSLGARPQSTWEEGSKVLFTDLSGGGMVGEVKVNQPFERLSVEYQGVVFFGEEDYSSQDARKLKGSRETYLLKERRGSTELNLKADISLDECEAMSKAWERALGKIKLLAEAK